MNPRQHALNIERPPQEVIDEAERVRIASHEAKEERKDDEKIQYDVVLVMDAGEVFEPVQKVCDDLDSCLALAGLDEKIRIQSRMPLWILTVARALEKDEETQMKSIIHGQLLTSGLSFRKAIKSVELSRRKSGHVLQSVS